MKKINKIIFKNLKKLYNDKIIFSDVNFEIDRGQIVKIDGLNGSGKSTLLRCISGIAKLNEGYVYLEYENGRKEKVHIDSGYYKRLITISNQNIVIKADKCPIDAIYEYVKFFNCKESKKNIINNIKYYIDLFEIKNDDLKRKIYQLSGGTQKKLEIIKTLIIDSDFIIFDEPLSGIDKNIKKKFKDILFNLKQNNKGVVLTDHGDFLNDLVDEFYIIEKGKLEKGEKYMEKINILLETEESLNIDEIKKIDGVYDAKIVENDDNYIEKKEELKDEDLLKKFGANSVFSVNIDSNDIKEPNLILEKLGIDVSKVKNVEFINVKDFKKKLINLELLINKEQKKYILANLLDYFEKNNIKYKNFSF